MWCKTKEVRYLSPIKAKLLTDLIFDDVLVDLLLRNVVLDVRRLRRARHAPVWRHAHRNSDFKLVVLMKKWREIYLQVISNGCSTAVEQTTNDPEVVGSTPAWFWAIDTGSMQFGAPLSAKSPYILVMLTFYRNNKTHESILQRLHSSKCQWSLHRCRANASWSRGHGLYSC